MLREGTGDPGMGCAGDEARGGPLPLITWEEDAEEPSEQALPDCPFLPHLSEYMLPAQAWLRIMLH